MRLSLLGVTAALGAALALSACSSTSAPSSAGLPSAPGGQVVTLSNGHKLLIRTAPGVKRLSGPQCGSQYSFCFYVEPGDSGPYVETSDGTAPLYNSATIVKSKNDKTAKKFSNYFYPDPGDPTYQYITYKGKVKKTQPVKYTDVYCIGFTPSDCANGSGATLYLGIALTPS